MGDQQLRCLPFIHSFIHSYETPGHSKEIEGQRGGAAPPEPGAYGWVGLYEKFV